MLTSLLLILAGLALLFFGGEFLVRGAASLALRLGLSPLVAGLTVVAFGTSTPELFASLYAAKEGQGDIAVGNVIGSNIFNVAVILGLTALIFPLKASAQILRFDVPVMIIVSLFPFWVLRDGHVTHIEAGIMLALLVGYVVAVVQKAKKVPVPEAVVSEYVDEVGKPSRSAILDASLIAVGLGLLIGGSHYLIEGSVSIARAFGVSEAIIGLTIVAAGTSTPELASSLIAAFRKHPDIALGNIVGSNIFNILAILGVTGLAHPLYSAGVGMRDIAVMFTFSILLLPLIRSGGKLDRTEGCCLLAGYGVYLFFLWPR
jgi:cation:H+ antiporter